MRKLYLVLTAIIFSCVSASAQYITIPDDHFKAFLLARYPGCFNASGDLDTTCVAITTEDSLVFTNDNSSSTSYEALAYFDGLIYLDLSNDPISNPPLTVTPMPSRLPSGLTRFIGNNMISSSNGPANFVALLPAGVIHVELSHSNIDDLSGKIWPGTLKYLDLSENKLNHSFGTLPNTLDTLICSAQQWNYGQGATLNSLTAALPSSLRYFDCSANSLNIIPALPSTLTYLNCSFQFWLSGLSMSVPVPIGTVVPALPSNLVTLKCSQNSFSSLPALPASLEYLDCSSGKYNNIIQGVPYNYVGLTSLTSLPAGLKYLDCSKNTLTALPTLPAGLEFLRFGDNTITSIPTLPGGLKGLDFNTTAISSIPTLPQNLNYLNCGGTPVSCLPHLPSTMTGAPSYINSVYNLVITSTNINCIPNFVPGMQVSSTTVLPLCNVINNTHACEINPIIAGNIFYDNNSNGIQDPGELPRANVRVDHNGTEYTFSDINGHYEVTGTTGNNTITIDPPVFYNPVPSAFTHNIISPNTIVTDLVALQPTAIFDSVKITVTPIASPRIGTNISYNIQYENIGTTAVGPDITINYDNTKLTYAGSSNASVTVTTNNITLAPGILQPGQTGSFTVRFFVVLTTAIGDTIHTVGIITGGASTCSDSTSDIIIGPLDPNDKQATPSLTTLQVNNGTFINYLIRFQNVGTASAINVVVTDTLSPMLQQNTLEMIGASHACKVTQTGNNLLFEFLNINLPDSNSNEAGSHGYIRFRIKPQLSLPENTVVLNRASIYFDFNAAVVTNDAATKIVSSLSPVPVTLFSFTGTVKPGNKAVLQWRTANETNTMKFEIEESLDGSRFNYKATEMATGMGDNAYSKSVALPAGIVYYRLKTIDTDGSYKYSNIIKLNNNKTGTGLIILNNPVRNILTIRLADESLANTKAPIFNSLGAMVGSFILINGEQQINLGKLPAGFYYIQTINGSEKIIISR